MSYSENLSSYGTLVQVEAEQLRAEVARLTAELAAANALLAKATEFEIDGWDVVQTGAGWRAAGWDDGTNDIEVLGPFPTAAAAVAAAEKASQP